MLFLLDGAVDRTMEEVVVATWDMFSRLCIDTLEWMLRRHVCKVTVLQSADQLPEVEYSGDFLFIVQVFIYRRKEKRRYGSQPVKCEVEPDKAIGTAI